MNWDALGAIGEIVGALAVVATLAYLAIQVKQNARSTIGSTNQAITRSQNELNVAVINDPGLSDILDRGVRDYASLEREEKRRFNTYYIAILNVYQDTYIQHVQNAAVEGQWQLSQVILSQIFGSKSMQLWWKNPRLSMRSRLLPQFVKELDLIVEQASSD